MVISVTPRCANASTMADVKVGMEPTCGDSATPLAPMGWCGLGVTVWSVLPVRGLHGGGQEVVHQRVAQQVALRVERHLLAHRDGKNLRSGHRGSGPR